MITKDELRNIIKNARIHVTDSEFAELQTQINEAIDMVSIIGELDLTAVEPMFYPNEHSYQFRDNDLELLTYRTALLANTKEAAAGYFKFPAVLKGSES